MALTLRKKCKHRIKKVIRIGHSKGVRFEKALMQKYGITEKVILEERDEGILLKPLKSKLSWADTYKTMAKEKENWSDLDDLAGEAL